MTLRDEVLEIRKRYPEFWAWAEMLYAICPPEIFGMTEDEKETRCFQGCDVCWKDYEESLEGWRNPKV